MPSPPEAYNKGPGSVQPESDNQPTIINPQQVNNHNNRTMRYENATTFATQSPANSANINAQNHLHHHHNHHHHHHHQHHHQPYQRRFHRSSIVHSFTTDTFDSVASAALMNSLAEYRHLDDFEHYRDYRLKFNAITKYNNIMETIKAKAKDCRFQMKGCDMNGNNGERNQEEDDDEEEQDDDEDNDEEMTTPGVGRGRGTGGPMNLSKILRRHRSRFRQVARNNNIEDHKQ